MRARVERVRGGALRGDAGGGCEGCEGVWVCLGGVAEVRARVRRGWLTPPKGGKKLL